MGQKNVLTAALIHKVQFLERQLKSQKPIGRKAVDFDPNERFARIPEIAYAKWEAEKAPEKYRDAEAAKLQDNSIQVALNDTANLNDQFHVLDK